MEERIYKSDEDRQQTIDELFNSTIHTQSGKNIYTQWNDFFEDLEKCDSTLQKKLIFYWSEKAFGENSLQNSPLFPLLCVTGGAAEVPKERVPFFEYIAEYLLAHTKEHPSIDKLVTQYVAKDCPDNKGRFGNIINTFRDILRKKYNRQQRKRILTSKLLMVTFGVLCGLAVGFLSGALVVFNITRSPDVSVAADEATESSITEVTSLLSEPSEVSSDKISSAADHDKKQSSAKNSRTEKPSSVSEPSNVSTVSSTEETSEQSSASEAFWKPSLPSVVLPDTETSVSVQPSDSRPEEFPTVSIEAFSQESSVVSVEESSEEPSERSAEESSQDTEETASEGND